ncbi:hypothetical protein [Mesonia aquimarina]|uniref:hypothetical protein n=1 Tax=Mesonia aquimarina TaxID=1504967 RepID=UPI000EF601A0|nr:hypothetical protein [Mesonia aquimarina]
MKTFRATYNTEILNNVNYDFNAESLESAEKFANNYIKSTSNIKVVEIDPETLLPIDKKEIVELAERQMQDVQNKVVKKEKLNDYEEVLFKYDTAYDRNTGAKKLVKRRLVKF